jgi:hypothetical protein
MNTHVIDLDLSSAESVAHDPPCERCGTFAPLRELRVRHLCDACLERRHWVEREPATLRGLMRGITYLLPHVAPRALPIVLLFSVPHIALSALGVPFLISQLTFFVSIPAYAATWNLCAQHLGGERLSTSRALADAFRAWGRLVGTTIARDFVAGIYLLLLVVPGIVKWLSFAASVPIALHESPGALGALAESERRMRGLRLPTFWALLILLIAPIAVGTALVVGIDALLHLSVPHRRLLAAVVTDVLEFPLLMLPAVLYAKTRDRSLEDTRFA